MFDLSRFNSCLVIMADLFSSIGLHRVFPASVDFSLLIKLWLTQTLFVTTSAFC